MEKERGLTQIDLANMLEVTNICVFRWEVGARDIPAFLHLALDCLRSKGKEGEKWRATRKRKRKGKGG